MNRSVIETIMGAVVLAIAGFFLVFAYKTAEIKSVSGYVLNADFDRIDGLGLGSDVRMSGVKIGSITDITLDKETYLAKVQIDLNPAYKVPTDTAAIVSSDGLMGGKYLALEPGAEEEMLENGGRISHAQSTPGLEQLLGQVIFSMQNKDKDE